MFRRAFRLGVLKLACRMVAEETRKPNLKTRIKRLDNVKIKFLKMQLPRRPIASAHKTVRRPAETNHRKKLAAKRA